MPSQSNFNKKLNFQCEKASYQQNNIDHRIPINNSFSSDAISANYTNMDYDDDDTQGI